jgi:hypothetical protein
VVDLSKKRLPASQAAETDVGPRYDACQGGHTATRAGRLLGLAGALCSRNPAFTGWPFSTRRTLPANTLRPVLWPTLPCKARDARRPGQGGGHPILQPRYGVRRQANQRILSLGLTRPGFMAMQAGITAKATLKG